MIHSPAESIWGLCCLWCLVASAVEDWRTQKIWPGYHKIGYICCLMAGMVAGRMLAVAWGGACFYGVGYLLWRARLMGGGDVKLLLPVGAYTTLLGIYWPAYLLTLTYTTFVYTLAWAIWLKIMTGKIGNEKKPFAPVYPLSIIGCQMFLARLGF